MQTRNRCLLFHKHVEWWTFYRYKYPIYDYNVIWNYFGILYRIVISIYDISYNYSYHTSYIYSMIRLYPTLPSNIDIGMELFLYIYISINQFLIYYINFSRIISFFRKIYKFV